VVSEILMRSRTICTVLILAFAPAPALAQQQGLRQPDWPSGPAAQLPKAEYLLQEDTKLVYDALTFAGGTVITTHGHDLDLHIRQSLAITGSLLIRAYGPADLPIEPEPVNKAEKGTSHDPGAGSEGAGPGNQGADGGTGASGHAGNPGLPGKDAGIITLNFDANAAASGSLVIENQGGRGGQGGNGGEGGDGGDGQQGGRGEDGPFDCASGPGQGGRGGDGGTGGPGGKGGTGGQGGIVILFTNSANVATWLDRSNISAKGGDQGDAGQGGIGGQPGRPGFGGRGSHHCQGKEADRMGGQGQPGQTSAQADSQAIRSTGGQIKKYYQ
jgi:hypothetical protein